MIDDKKIEIIKNYNLIRNTMFIIGFAFSVMEQSRTYNDLGDIFFSSIGLYLLPFLFPLFIILPTRNFINFKVLYPKSVLILYAICWVLFPASFYFLNS